MRGASPGRPRNRRSQEPAALQRRESNRHLRDALARDELVVRYQPIVDAATAQLVSAEALLRWRDPARDSDELPRLLHAVEQSPVIYALERWAVGVCFAE